MAEADDVGFAPAVPGVPTGALTPPDRQEQRLITAAPEDAPVEDDPTDDKDDESGAGRIAAGTPGLARAGPSREGDDSSSNSVFCGPHFERTSKSGDAISDDPARHAGFGRKDITCVHGSGIDVKLSRDTGLHQPRPVIDVLISK